MNSDAYASVPTQSLAQWWSASLVQTAARPSQADTAYLTFRLAQGCRQLLLPAGTLVDGGKDAQGRRIVFATAADAELGDWRVEALTTLLCLSAQRLLCYEGVRTGRTSVNLVVYQVNQLQHVCLTYSHRAIKRFTRATIVDSDFSSIVWVKCPGFSGFFAGFFKLAVNRGARRLFAIHLVKRGEFKPNS